jgi:hypothetical protein
MPSVGGTAAINLGFNGFNSNFLTGQERNSLCFALKWRAGLVPWELQV